MRLEALQAVLVQEEVRRYCLLVIGVNGSSARGTTLVFLRGREGSSRLLFLFLSYDLGTDGSSITLVRRLVGSTRPSCLLRKASVPDIPGHSAYFYHYFSPVHTLSVDIVFAVGIFY